jgi:hypothetical protein
VFQFVRIVIDGDDADRCEGAEDLDGDVAQTADADKHGGAAGR